MRPSSGPRWIAALLVTHSVALSGGLSGTRPAAAGSLEKFEKPHKAPPSSQPSSSGSSSSSSSSSSSTSSPGSGDGTLAALFWCTVLLPITGICLNPYHHAVSDPYGPDFPPRAPGQPPEYRLPEQHLRHFEVHVGGFVAKNADVFARTFGLRSHFGPLIVGGTWDRLYETPEPGSLARLDLVRIHATSALTADLTNRLEIYPMAGALLMRGTENTWAFDLGLEARVYPISPLSVRASTFASIFRYGPTLFDTRLELGLSFDRFELHGGLRWLTQAHAQGFAGPTAGLTVRL